MSDRIVYLVTKLTEKHKKSDLCFVDDKGLSSIMSKGYEQVASMERKVEGSKAVMLTLRPAGENRGVSLRKNKDEEGTVTISDDFGNRKTLGTVEALVAQNRQLTVAIESLSRGVGHLGSAGSHTNIPGLTIISGETVGKAFDIGQTAAMTGRSVSDCPFPVGTSPHTLWLRGFRSGSSTAKAEVSDSSAEEAYRLGNQVARELGEEDAAHCPYPVGSPFRHHWLRGFTEGGGRVL